MKEWTGRPWRLVLSGGATGGAYWMAGALEAISAAGLDPASAELIVGTSAGALVGTVAALGGRPWDLVGNTAPEPRGGPMADPVARRAARGRARDFLRHRLIPHMGVRVSAAIASLIPAGIHSTDHIAALIRDLLDTGVAPHRGLRISTVDRLSARRVVFGPDPESLPQAVAASCAVPGWFVPVEIDGAYYVDGGVHSNFSLDVAADVYGARVIVLSPLSGAVPASRDAGWLAMGVARAEIKRMLRREVRRAARVKAQVLVMEPEVEEVVAMGLNLMDDSRGVDIHALALERTRARLLQPAWQTWIADTAGLVQGARPGVM